MEIKSPRILAIDDNADNLISVRALVTETFPSAVLFTAMSGQQGIQLAHTESPDLILLDIVMPVMDGFEVCQIVKNTEELSDIPVICLTAIKGDKASRLKALDNGADAFLAKPIDEIELIAQIRAMLKIRAAALRRRNEKQILAAMLEEKTQELSHANNDLRVTVVALEKENTLRSISEKELFFIAEKYCALLNDLPGMVCECSPDGVISFANAAYCQFAQANIDDVIGDTFLNFLGDEAIANAYSHYNLLSSENPTNQHQQCLFRQGNETWIEWYHRALFDDEGRLSMIYSIGIDITMHKTSEKELTHLSYHDHLTGLYNRRFFEKELERLDVARNYPLSLIIGDVNGLKLVNDSFGHAAGDDILKLAGDLFRRECRSDDIVARVGGDEFALILPSTSKDEALSVINRVKESVNDSNLSKNLLSISFGIATKLNGEQNLVNIMSEAEDSMYTHKMYESASMRNRTVNVIMSALWEKSPREMSHSQRVSDICIAIARELGLDQDSIQRVGASGLVHDIGKIGVDENLLNKPGSLDTDEWEQIQKHSEAGWRILNSAQEFVELAKFVLNHHERWDGNGYPEGLKGEDIPLESRIIAIADTYDAITQDRPYRPGASGEYALAEISRSAGTQFDPVLAQLFVNRVGSTILDATV